MKRSKVKSNNNNSQSKVKTSGIINSDKDNNDIQSKIDRSLNTYSLVNSWIENADNKANVSIAISSVVLGVITFLSQSFKVDFICDDTIYIALFIVYVITLILSVLIWAIAILCHLKSITPDLTSNSNVKKNEKRAFPIFFKDIAQLEMCDYKELILKGKDQQYLDELIAETHQNSEICTDKMKSLRKGVCLFTYSFIFSFISLFVHILLFFLLNYSQAH